MSVAGHRPPPAAAAVMGAAPLRKRPLPPARHVEHFPSIDIPFGHRDQLVQPTTRPAHFAPSATTGPESIISGGGRAAPAMSQEQKLIFIVRHLSAELDQLRRANEDRAELELAHAELRQFVRARERIWKEQEDECEALRERLRRTIHDGLNSATSRLGALDAMSSFPTVAAIARSYTCLMNDLRHAVMEDIDKCAHRPSGAALVAGIHMLICECLEFVEHVLGSYRLGLHRTLFSFVTTDQKEEPSAVLSSSFTSGDSSGDDGLLFAFLRRHHSHHMHQARSRKHANVLLRSLAARDHVAAAPLLAPRFAMERHHRAWAAAVAPAPPPLADAAAPPPALVDAPPRHSAPPPPVAESAAAASLESFVYELIRVSWEARLNSPPLAFTHALLPSASAAASFRMAFGSEHARFGVDPLAVAFPALVSDDGTVLVKGEVFVQTP